MEFASAPVRPGFVLLWIAAVTGSSFFVLDWMCPDRPAREANAVPGREAGAAPTSTLRPADASPVLGTVAPLTSGDPLADVARAAPAAEEVEADPVSAEPPPAEPTGTAAEPVPAPFLHSFRAGGDLFLLPSATPIRTGAPILSASVGDEDADEDELSRLEVSRLERGRYLLRLLLARLGSLAPGEVPAELADLLPESVKHRLARAGHTHSFGGGEPGTGESLSGGAGRGLRQHLRRRGDRSDLVGRGRRKLEVLLDEEEFHQLRARLLRAARNRSRG
ncbi:MAG: hypothetical protein D6702_04130 [Planctomycetota bacterium]|nr:MAG: hypothetical protein D6702_04130 [Planctomycetota bacterium]